MCGARKRGSARWVLHLVPAMQRVSYWLMPAGPDRQRLIQIVRELAARFEGPVFDPHLTLYSGPVDSIERVSDLLRKIAGAFRPMTMRTTGVGRSDEFTKTLFIECEGNPALSSISAAIKAGSAGEDYELRPHVSLLYSNVAAAARRHLAREVSAPAMVHFDAVRAVLTGGHPKCRRDVEEWRTLAECRLAVR